MAPQQDDKLWRYLLTEIDWDQLVTNVLALLFSSMSVAVIAFAVIARKDTEFVASVGAVTTGITGVILGYYFNRSRLKEAQVKGDFESQERERATSRAMSMRLRLGTLKAQYESLTNEFEEYVNATEPVEEGGQE